MKRRVVILSVVAMASGAWLGAAGPIAGAGGADYHLYFGDLPQPRGSPMDGTGRQRTPSTMPARRAPTGSGPAITTSCSRRTSGTPRSEWRSGRRRLDSWRRRDPSIGSRTGRGDHRQQRRRAVEQGEFPRRTARPLARGGHSRVLRLACIPSGRDRPLAASRVVRRSGRVRPLDPFRDRAMSSIEIHNYGSWVGAPAAGASTTTRTRTSPPSTTAGTSCPPPSPIPTTSTGSRARRCGPCCWPSDSLATISSMRCGRIAATRRWMRTSAFGTR